MNEAIYEHAEDYDLEHEGDHRDVRFYRALVARTRATRVLELACGSGRLTLPIAAALPAGGRIVGVECDPHMLEQAAQKRAEVDDDVARRIHLEAGDMRHWQARSRFHLVIVGGSSIAHLLTIDEQLAVWGNAFEHLLPNGLFVVDIAMPNFGACAESQRMPPRALTEVDLDQSDAARGLRLIRQRTTRFDAFAQRQDVQFLYDKFDHGTHVERFVSDFTGHVYFPRELELLYRLAGFHVDAVWGDFTFRRATAQARDLIIAGRRP